MLREQTGAFESLDGSLGFVINKVALILKNEFDKELAAYGITAIQFSIMKRLWEEDGLSQKALAERTFKTTPEMTNLIDKLERKGLVIREANEHDRRGYRIRLTAEGRAIETAAVDAAHRTLGRALQGISDEEVKELLKLLERIFANLYVA